MIYIFLFDSIIFISGDKKDYISDEWEWLQGREDFFD